MTGLNKQQSLGPHIDAQVRLFIRTERKQGIYYGVVMSGAEAGEAFVRAVMPALGV